MHLLNEFADYIMQYNPLSKRICKMTCGIVFALLILALYFVMAAGRTQDYYFCMEAFEVIIENIRSVAGIGFFFAIILEPVYKKQYGETDL